MGGDNAPEKKERTEEGKEMRERVYLYRTWASKTRAREAGSPGECSDEARREGERGDEGFHLLWIHKTNEEESDRV